MKSNYQLEVNVGVKIDLAIGGVLNLFEHKPVATENSQRRPCVVRRDVEFIPAADFHGKEMALEIVVEGGDLWTRVVVDVSNSGGVSEVRIEELQVLTQTGPAGHAPPQAIVTVDHRPAAAFTVDSGQKPLGAVLEDLRAPLAQEAVLIQPVLNVTQPGDPVPKVVAERGQPRAATRVQ